MTLTRTNVQRPHRGEHPSLRLLRDNNIGVEIAAHSPHTVATDFLFWPETGFWRRTKGPRQGYGVRELIAAVRTCPTINVVPFNV